MISQIYVEPTDQILCHIDGANRYSVEVHPTTGGVPFRVLLSRSQLGVLHCNVGDALRRLDDLDRLRDKVDTALSCRPVVAEAVSHVRDRDDDTTFIKEMSDAFEPAMPPAWAERDAPRGDF